MPLGSEREREQRRGEARERERAVQGVRGILRATGRQAER